MMNHSGIRVRFAPSPTGPLHIGGVRTALYNYLFARKHNGVFILRIEDTDQKRFVPGAETYITDALHWCGLIPDESTQAGGPYAPYRQSERTSLYHQYIQRLLDNGFAYYAFDSPSDLEKLRKDGEKTGHHQFQYDSITRYFLTNSLTLSSSDVSDRISRGDPYVIRLKIPENETISFSDLIRGDVVVHSKNLDDKVLFKSDGLPTYHFANVVDDHLMNISHVIRGEEWLPSAPLHLLLYRFLGWETEMPEFAHLPLILKPDGNGKLSKRDGDRLGFPVFPLQWKDPFTQDTFSGYRESGYLPDAFINILSLLGWNPGTEQELFSLESLTELFSIDRITKSGSRFDPEKARWFNHQYLQQIPVTDLYGRLIRFFHDSGLTDITILLEKDPAFSERVISLCRDRASLLPELWDTVSFFFSPPVKWDESVSLKIWKPETTTLISEFLEYITPLESWNTETIHEYIKTFSEKKEIKPAQLLNPLRFLLVGSNKGPGMLDILAVFGKTEFTRRIVHALQTR